MPAVRVAHPTGPRSAVDNGLIPRSLLCVFEAVQQLRRRERHREKLSESAAAATNSSATGRLVVIKLLLPFPCPPRPRPAIFCVSGK